MRDVYKRQYINRLSIPIGKVELLPPLPRKYVSVSDAGYVKMCIRDSDTRVCRD